MDGQDNPVVASKLMKFDEVTTQFVLTKHVIAYDVMSIRSKIWDAMKPDQQAKFQAAAEKMSDDNIKRFDAQEIETLEYFKKEGKKVKKPSWDDDIDINDIVPDIKEQEKPAAEDSESAGKDAEESDKNEQDTAMIDTQPSTSKPKDSLKKSREHTKREMPI